MRQHVTDATITVNGKRRPFAASDVAALLEGMGYGSEPAGVAVALNGSVVPRSRWHDERLSPGDAVEIVGAVQGG